MGKIEQKELFVPVGDTKFFCRTFGNPTSSPIIVLHGGPGLGSNYLLPQLAELGKFSFAIFYDQRGTGKSITNDDNWQRDPFEIYVDDIDQIRKAFGFKKISLLAHSYGGVFAALYALKYPAHVDKIIFVNTVPLSSKDYLEFVKHRMQLVDTNKAQLDPIRESAAFLQGDPATVEKFYRIYFKNYFVNTALANTLTLTMSAEAAVNNFKIYNFFYDYVTKNSFDAYDRLSSLKKPTLIIACDKDVIPLHYMQRLHKCIPSSQFILIKDSGHFPYIDQPKILFDAIENFL